MALVTTEQGLTQAIYAVVQADEQVEKVGPGGSPSGEEKPGGAVTPGVKVVWAWAVVRRCSVITMHSRTKAIRNARNAIIATSSTEAPLMPNVAK